MLKTRRKIKATSGCERVETGQEKQTVIRVENRVSVLRFRENDENGEEGLMAAIPCELTRLTTGRASS